ncbi:MAG: hypothetical protein HQK88_02445 [Nitrospirae bacterium]|nr:hypothetical protein [Nitrospirota bacterium]MBF0534360.1 hypothetical protein [Nitrospirota bacterium]MBF0615659.1 hypothetical protein [Nitrospirota bacterium]
MTKDLTVFVNAFRRAYLKEALESVRLSLSFVPACFTTQVIVCVLSEDVKVFLAENKENLISPDYKVLEYLEGEELERNSRAMDFFYGSGIIEGKYFHEMSDDDVVEPVFYGLALNVLRNQNVPMVTFHWDMIYEDGSCGYRMPFFKRACVISGKEASRLALVSSFRHAVATIAETELTFSIRKSARTPILGDVHEWLHWCMQAGFAWLPVRGFWYRVYPTSMWDKNLETIDGNLDLYMEYLKVYKEKYGISPEENDTIESKLKDRHSRQGRAARYIRAKDSSGYLGGGPYDVPDGAVLL